ncbi:hypothetical protein OPQ81_003680 [Rhizoctonia solani]|nr:hypothetical protein OPQ81_003680 [Rhizoctonia solani]
MVTVRVDTATIAVRSTYSVATSANIIAVKAIHFTVAAGGSNIGAANASLALVAAANTISAVDSSDRRGSFSNYGSVLDVWAIGMKVWDLNGRPLVAGVLAFAIGDHGDKYLAELSADLKIYVRAVVTGVPSRTTNLLATR